MTTIGRCYAPGAIRIGELTIPSQGQLIFV
jgi:hypothetical protein